MDNHGFRSTLMSYLLNNYNTLAEIIMRKEKYIVERTKNNGHYLEVSIPYYCDGKRKFYSKSFNVARFATATECMNTAKYWRDVKLKEIGSGYSFAHTPTVFELFVQTRELYNIPVKTWKRHVSAYKHGIDAYANIAITDIKASDIQLCINRAIEQYSTEATQRVLALWRQIYKTATMQDIPVSDKTIAVIIPKKKAPAVEKKQVLISDDDFFKYTNWLQTTYKYTRDPKGKHRKLVLLCLIWIMYYTGIRPSEAYALQRSDIDMVNNTISITKAVGSTLNETRKIINTKTPQSVRTVPICSELHTILEEYLSIKDGEYIFYDYDGLPFETSQVAVYIAHTAKLCGVQFNLYMLRHRMATDLIQNGVSPRTTQDILGHASFNQSIGYARSSTQEQLDAVNNRKK